MNEMSFVNTPAIHHHTYKSCVIMQMQMQTNNHHFMSNVIIGIIVHALVISYIFGYF